MRQLGDKGRAIVRMRQANRRGFLAALLSLTWTCGADAILIGTTSGVVPATNVNPASFPGWSNGDPGWENVTSNPSGVGTYNNYVYLGDGWVLSARHVGVGAVQ